MFCEAGKSGHIHGLSPECGRVDLTEHWMHMEGPEKAKWGETAKALKEEYEQQQEQFQATWREWRERQQQEKCHPLQTPGQPQKEQPTWRATTVCDGCVCAYDCVLANVCDGCADRMRRLRNRMRQPRRRVRAATNATPPPH